MGNKQFYRAKRLADASAVCCMCGRVLHWGETYYGFNRKSYYSKNLNYRSRNKHVYCPDCYELIWIDSDETDEENYEWVYNPDTDSWVLVEK